VLGGSRIRVELGGVVVPLMLRSRGRSWEYRFPVGRLSRRTNGSCGWSAHDDVRGALLAVLGDSRHTPEAQALLQAALTRKAWLLEKGVREQHHEPLEWLGDRVLNLLIAHELWRRFPFADEGRLDVARSRLCGEALLAEVGRSIRIVDALRTGKGEHDEGQAAKDGPVADHVEAVVGAAYLVAGLDGAGALVARLLAVHWPEVLPAATASGGGLDDPMSELNRWVQARWGRSLHRTDDWRVERAGPDHAPTHVATVTLPDQRQFTGPPVQGKAQKAKAAAAAVALRALAADEA
jgi:ribonuclease-3